MKRLLFRLAAGILASVVLVAAVSLLDTTKGKRTDGLYYQVTGIHPDAQMVKVDGEPTDAETYFYWLDYGYEYILSRLGEFDLDAALDENTTYGQYVENNAIYAITYYSVVRSWAAENGITLNEESQEAFEQDRQSTFDYYGGEEGFLQQLETVGISEEGFFGITELSYLYDTLLDTFCTEGSVLYPDADSIAAYAENSGYVTAKILYWYDDADEKNTASASAESAAAALSSAADVDAIFTQLSSEAGYTFDGITFTVDDAGEAVYNAVSALAVGEVSPVISDNSGYYVAIRQDLNTQDLISNMFDAEFQTRIDNATVVFNTSLHDKVDVKTFITQLTEARNQMSDTSADAQG